MSREFTYLDYGYDILLNRTSGIFGDPTSLMDPVEDTSLDLVQPDDIASGDLVGNLNIPTSGHIRGGATDYSEGEGFWLGYRLTERDYGFFIGNGSGDYLRYNTTDDVLELSGSIIAAAGTIGGFDIGTDYIRDVANSFGLASTITAGNDVRFWAGGTFALRTSAALRIYENGAVVGSSFTITGGSISTSTLNGIIAQGNLNVADRGWAQTSAFTVTDADTVAWGAGTFTSADGTAYSISAGNTGNMAAKTYIYLDTLISTTVYQITTTPTLAVGAGKVLVAIAQNGTGEATFSVLDGQGGQNIDASSIVANSITANELSTSIIYAGVITIDTSGNIHSGQSSYNSGTGFFLGNVAGTPKFSIGDTTAGNSMTWDGTTLRVNGSTLGFEDIFGDGSDGTVTISSNTSLTRDMFYDVLVIDNTFTLNPAGYRIFCRTSLTNNGTLARNGLAGGNALLAVGGTAGAALADGSIKGAVAGQAGPSVRNNSGVNGNTVAKSLGVAGVAGGSGDNTSGADPSGGAAGTRTGTVFNTPRNAFAAYMLYDFLPAGDNLRSSSGSGSGAAGDFLGGTGNFGAGGGSASPGGIVAVYAKTITNNGTISANGANGGNGGNGASGVGSSGGGGGGGGASSGGVVMLVYSNYTNAGTVSTTGGTGGSPGQTSFNGVLGVGTATAGADGNTGVVIELQV